MANMKAVEKYVGKRIVVQFGPHESNQASGMLTKRGETFEISGFVFTEPQVDRIDSKKRMIFCK